MRKLQLLIGLVFLQQVVFAQGDMVLNMSKSTYILQESTQGEQIINVLKKIEEKYGAYFSYDPDLLKQKEISSDAKLDGDLEETLQAILTPSGLRFQKMGENYYTILPARKVKTKEVEQAAPKLEIVKPVKKDEIPNKGRNTTSERIIHQKLKMKDLSVRSALYSVNNLTGKVIDINGEPLIGVNVLVKGTNEGTATNLLGEFSLSNVEDDAVLLVSYIGYQTQEVRVDGRSNIVITLVEESAILDQVVVVGYNTVEREHVASSIETVDMDRLRTRPMQKLQEGFSGTVAGVTMMQGNN